jgi:hypothetical protein
MFSENTAVESPDRRKAVHLTYAGEARFGPVFCVGSSTGFPWLLGDSTIGDDVHWSPDSRFVVVMVFCSRDTSRTPRVRLTAIDSRDGTLTVIDENLCGLFQQYGFVSESEYAYARVEGGVESIGRWTAPTAKKETGGNGSELTHEDAKADENDEPLQKNSR